MDTNLLNTGPKKNTLIIYQITFEIIPIRDKDFWKKSKNQKLNHRFIIEIECNKFEFFAFFSLKNYFFCENEASSEHLNVSFLFQTFLVIFKSYRWRPF